MRARTVLALAAAAAALALLAASAAVSHRREARARASPWPVVESTGPLGLAALHAWLAESGRGPVLLEAPGDRPPAGAVLLLAAPRAELAPEDAALVLAHAERGGTVVWALGPAGSQPELERRLAVSRWPAASPPPGRTAVALAPHPAFSGLALRWGGAAAASALPEALAVAGEEDGGGERLRAAALSVRWGAGEVIVLASADLAANDWILHGDNLSLWARLATRGTVAIDERWREPRAGPLPPSGRGLALVAGQGLLAALAFFWARGRRLGAVRPPSSSEAGPTAADYVASLGALYRRARAEPELAREAWRQVRLRLQRAAGVPATLDDEAAARRLAAVRPAAASPFRAASALARAGGGPRELASLVRAIARVEDGLAATRQGGFPRRSGL